ncbi:MAG: deoxyuridine 5'-triphosphate nucleotidohydrolase [Methermicoccaceae archaeon]
MLSKGSLMRLVEEGLIRDAPSIAEQVQPNGIDLTLRSVMRFTSEGRLAFDNAERVNASTEEIPFEPSGWVHLPMGAYMVRFNEVVSIPAGYGGLAMPRSSLLRSGAAMHTAVWDAGYVGRGMSLMSVYNPHGFWVKRDARIVQLVLFSLDEVVDEVYGGEYLGEGVG